MLQTPLTCRDRFLGHVISGKQNVLRHCFHAPSSISGPAQQVRTLLRCSKTLPLSHFTQAASSVTRLCLICFCAGGVTWFICLAVMIMRNSLLRKILFWQSVPPAADFKCVVEQLLHSPSSPVFLGGQNVRIRPACAPQNVNWRNWRKEGA